MLSGVSTNVWASDETIPKQNIADKMFAPTSTTNIEQPNDFEPVAYQANRALMAANAAKELNELQKRNHATTAYTTLGCVAQPLFPSFDAQRAVNCSRRQAMGVGMVTNSPSLVSQPPPLGYQPDVALVGDNVQINPLALGVPGYYNLSVPPVPMKKKEPNKMMNSVRGALYDMKHWDELPAEGTKDTLSFVCTRDNRLPYLLLFITIIVLLIALLGVVISFTVKNKAAGSPYPSYPPYPLAPISPIQ